MLHISFYGLSAPQDTAALDEVRRSFEFALDRFKYAIRDVEVRFRDLNGPKGGIDKSCQVQLRFMPRGLAVVRGRGTTYISAAYIARERAVQALTRRLGRRARDRRLPKPIHPSSQERSQHTPAEATELAR